MAALEVRGLTYSYPGSPIPALKNLSFQVEPGEMLGVIGANGAGKSTLLLALAGLIPSLFHGEMRGEVRVGGLDTRGLPAGEFAGRVGLVLQNPVNQLSGLRYTVFEEVAFGLENLGVAPAEMPERIERSLAQVGLRGFEERSPFDLSGGQQQRLALASILALQPPILLLDEPTAMLDPQGSGAIVTIIRDLVKAGAAVMVAGHDLEWMARESIRVMALARGEMILYGPPQEVLASPLLEEGGIGRLRFSRAAERGQAMGIWPEARPLPVTLEDAAEGFRRAREDRIWQEPDHADLL